jgi:phosphotriesterase-related protein
MPPLVQLTNGRIPCSELGRTLIHEHVLVGMPGWNLDLKAPKFLRAEAMARAVDKLQELQSHGCRTIVDPCPMDLGRDVEFVAEVAQRSGTNIVVAAGVYNELPRLAELGLTAEEMDQILVGNPRALFTNAAAHRAGANH